MKDLWKVCLFLIKFLTGFFVITFIVYFFNLDMKLTAALEPTIQKLQERVPRDRHL
ncbi:MAG: hypothetical protein IJ201_03880 [Solobacterium sp.]|jgi:hypothetical protein|nr:hypothetical protein [Solobacterium sp.]